MIPLAIAVAIGFAAATLVISVIALLRHRRAIRTPGWPPRDWRALLALVASVAGSASLTGFAGWLVWILWQGGWPIATAEMRIGILGKALLLSLGGSLVVLISLGLAINRRSVKVGRDGIEVSGGDDAPTPSVVTTTRTEVQSPPPPSHDD